MKPTQVWLPLFKRGIGFEDSARDMRRALQAWDCDQRIWILPSLKGPIVWREEWAGTEARIRAVPGEQLECLDVYHVGENGHVFGPPVFDRFVGYTCDELLDKWLNWANDGAIRWRIPPEIVLEVPEIVGDRIGDREFHFRAPVTPFLPGVKGGVQLRNLEGLSPVFAEAELSERLRKELG